MTTSPQEDASDLNDTSPSDGRSGESAPDAEGTDVGGQAATTESGVEDSVTGSDDGEQDEDSDRQGKNPL